VRLDVDVDWAEIGTICEDAYRAVAPKRLVAQLDEVQERKGGPAADGGRGPRS